MKRLRGNAQGSGPWRNRPARMADGVVRAASKAGRLLSGAIEFAAACVARNSLRVLAAIHAPEIERAQVFEMQRTHRERERLAEEYASGYLVGWRECFQACLEVVEDEIAGADASGASCDIRTWLPIDVKPRQEN